MESRWSSVSTHWGSGMAPNMSCSTTDSRPSLSQHERPSRLRAQPRHRAWLPLAMFPEPYPWALEQLLDEDSWLEAYSR
jgi:hypothetical protein